MNVGDRVTLTPAAVNGANKRMKGSYLDWTGRVGKLESIQHNGMLGVLWDGRSSIDWWPPIAIVKIANGEKITPQPAPGPAHRGPRAKPTRKRYKRRIA